MDECKKEKVDTNLDLKVNIKNKAILLKGENMDKQFESIKDTIQYFNTLNIKIDRKALYLCILFFFEKKRVAREKI